MRISRRRIVLWVTAWVLLLTLIAGGNRIWATLVGAEYHPINKSLEGARILDARRDPFGIAGSLGANLLIAGTSRTMADYDAVLLADTVGKHADQSTNLVGYNLGSVANYPSKFIKQYSFEKPVELWILEFSPHMLLDYDSARESDSEADSWTARFRSYRQSQLRAEALFSGRLSQITHFDDRARLTPGNLCRIGLAAMSVRVDQKSIFYAALYSTGFGQAYHRNGHVFYYRYLTGPEGTDAIRGMNPGEIPGYRTKLRRPFAQEQWDAYTTWISEVRNRSSVVVVRPPVDPAMYILENELAGAIIDRTRTWLLNQGVPYIDMNTFHYHSTDRSHIDWYDTERVTRDLATEITRLALFN